MATKCSVSVYVRARPILHRREEEEGGGGICLSIKGKGTTIWDPTDHHKKRTFSFDRSFNSLTPDAEEFASQEMIYEVVGLPSLEQAMKGYNTTIFAYGQTGSGKTYTMMGHESLAKGKHNSNPEELHAETGVIPRFCVDLFNRIENQQQGSVTISHRVESVYYEIYNDKVHDLLDSSQSKTYKVREHPKLGPYVEGLQHCQVKNYTDVNRLLKRGARDRHTAKTSMNDVSSRSHAVLELVLTTSKFDPQTGDLSETNSRIALVDLAGSERQTTAKTSGERLKEGSSINKGLLSLGNVIEALASNTEGKSKKHQRFVQYRDSTLTWLLKEALGGNSRTAMLATLSPSALNYEETLSTLKYADRAKKIQNAVSVNKDSKKQVIFQLREEIRMLKAEIEQMRSDGAASPVGGNGYHPAHVRDVRVWREDPYLLQIDPLPTLNEPILYWIEGSQTCYISSTDASGESDVLLDDASAQTPFSTADYTIKLPKSKGVLPYHVLLVKASDHVKLIPTNGSAYDGTLVTATPRSDDGKGNTLVDGIQVFGEEKLMSGSHLTIGEFEFIYVDPENVSDCVRFMHRINKLERAEKETQRQQHVTAKKVQNILIGSGVEASQLPSEQEIMSTKGREGDQILGRGAEGPQVYVWHGDTENGQWSAVDQDSAELAAAALVDKKKQEAECCRRLATLVSGTVSIDTLPLEVDLPKKPPTGEAGPYLVRTKEGLKVVQYDDVTSKWEPVSEPVAELTARNMVEAVEKKEREAQAQKFQEQIQEKVTDLDQARSELAANQAKHERETEILKKQLQDRLFREDELKKQLQEKEKLLHTHKTTAMAERYQLTDKIETLIEEYEERLHRGESIIQNLESEYSNAKYEWRKNETLLDATTSAKQKALEANTKLREELQMSNQETQQIRQDYESLRETLGEKDTLIEKLQKNVQEAEQLRRESASDEIKQIQALLDKKDTNLQAITEEKEQIDGNLRRLSKLYLTLQDELKEQQSRLVEYREQMESEQELARQEQDKAAHLTADAEKLTNEKAELLAKIKAMQNDPKKKEAETKRKAENEMLKQRLETLEQERKQAEGSRNYAEQAIRGEKQRNYDLQQRVKETTKQYQTMKEAYDSINERFTAMKAQMQNQKEELSSAKTQLKQITQAPGFVTQAEQGRRDLDLSIQLEMVREENVRLQQRAADLRMLHERSTDHAKQLSKDKSDLETLHKKTKKKLTDKEEELNAMTSRVDRLREMNDRLRQDAPKKKGNDDPPQSGRNTNPYGTGHAPTPRRVGGQGGSRKRSVSNDVKAPNYAKPTGSWMSRDDGPGTSSTPDLAKTLPSKMRGPSPAKITPRKGRNKKSAPSPAAGATSSGAGGNGVSPPSLGISPRVAVKRSISDPPPK